MLSFVWVKMGGLLISLSLLLIGIHFNNGHSLSKIELKQPAELVYEVHENQDGKTLTITSPDSEKPTLREIIYYHIIEKPYYDEQGTDETEPKKSAADPNEEPLIDQRKDHAEDDSSLAESSRKRVKRELTYRRYPSGRRFKRGSRRRMPSAPSLSKLDLNQLPEFVKKLLTLRKPANDVNKPAPAAKDEEKSEEYLSNDPNEAGDKSNKTVPPGKQQNETDYGMGLQGNGGVVWNKLKDSKYSYLVGQLLDKFEINADSSSEESPDSNESNVSDENSSSYINCNIPENSNSSRSLECGNFIEDPDVEESGSDERSNEADDNAESRSDSKEDSRSDEGSDVDGYSNEDSRYDSVSGEDDDSRSNEYGDLGSMEGFKSDEIDDSGEFGDDYDHYDDDDSYEDDDDSKFDDILDELHNIFVEQNSSIELTPGLIDKPENISIIDFLESVINSTKAHNKPATPGIIIKFDPKKSTFLNILEMLLTNIIKNNIGGNKPKPAEIIPNKEPNNNKDNGKDKPVSEPTTKSYDTTTESFKNVSTTTEKYEKTTKSNNPKEKEQPNEKIPPKGSGKCDEKEPENGDCNKNENPTSSFTDKPVTKPDNEHETTTKGNETEKPPKKGKDETPNEKPDEVPDETEKPPKKGTDETPNEKPDEVPDETEKPPKTDKTTSEKPDEVPAGTEIPPNKDKDEIVTEKHDKGTTKSPPKEPESIDVSPSKEPDNKNPPEVDKKIDYMLDLINNEKFWKFMGDLGAKYLESLIARTKFLIKGEITAQMQEYLDALNKLKDKAPLDHKNDETKKPNEDKFDQPKDNKNKTDTNAMKDKVPVNTTNVYGNTVGNDKVTNVYIFYPDKNVDEIFKHIQHIIDTKGNSTNIFAFGGDQHKPDHGGSHKNDKGNNNEDLPSVTTESTKATINDFTDRITTEPFTETTTKHNPKDNTDSSFENPDHTGSIDYSDSTTEGIIETTTATSDELNPNKEEVPTDSGNNQPATKITLPTEVTESVTPKVTTASIDNTVQTEPTVHKDNNITTQKSTTESNDEFAHSTTEKPPVTNKDGDNKESTPKNGHSTTEGYTTVLTTTTKADVTSESDTEDGLHKKPTTEPAITEKTTSSDDATESTVQSNPTESDQDGIVSTQKSTTESSDKFTHNSTDGPPSTNKDDNKESTPKNGDRTTVGYTTTTAKADVTSESNTEDGFHKEPTTESVTTEKTTSSDDATESTVQTNPTESDIGAVVSTQKSTTQSDNEFSRETTEIPPITDAGDNGNVSTLKGVDTTTASEIATEDNTEATSPSSPAVDVIPNKDEDNNKSTTEATIETSTQTKSTKGKDTDANSTPGVSIVPGSGEVSTESTTDSDLPKETSEVPPNTSTDDNDDGSTTENVKPTTDNNFTKEPGTDTSSSPAPGVDILPGSDEDTNEANKDEKTTTNNGDSSTASTDTDAGSSSTPEGPKISDSGEVTTDTNADNKSTTESTNLNSSSTPGVALIPGSDEEGESTTKNGDLTTDSNVTGGTDDDIISSTPSVSIMPGSDEDDKSTTKNDESTTDSNVTEATDADLNSSSTPNVSILPKHDEVTTKANVDDKTTTKRDATDNNVTDATDADAISSTPSVSIMPGSDEDDKSTTKNDESSPEIVDPDTNSSSTPGVSLLPGSEEVTSDAKDKPTTDSSSTDANPSSNPGVTLLPGSDEERDKETTPASLFKEETSPNDVTVSTGSTEPTELDHDNPDQSTTESNNEGSESSTKSSDLTDATEPTDVDLNGDLDKSTIKSNEDNTDKTTESSLSTNDDINKVTSEGENEATTKKDEEVTAKNSDEKNTSSEKTDENMKPAENATDSPTSSTEGNKINDSSSEKSGDDKSSEAKTDEPKDVTTDKSDNQESTEGDKSAEPSTELGENAATTTEKDAALE